MVVPKLIALTTFALAHHVLAQVAFPWPQVPQYVPVGKVSFWSAFVLEAGSDTGHYIQLALLSTTTSRNACPTHHPPPTLPTLAHRRQRWPVGDHIFRSSLDIGPFDLSGRVNRLEVGTLSLARVSPP
ncbi:hypothetical protein FIBSPDRAFT_935835 [Athelia psychrophila]|uniref:Uncharacterized protein n=1 Tax=Athelia psychrophila TaxID=1759441 RepID=A0A166D558_9AGAM|nr:hypothetical protein FIBSPDRAFT_935835 [Fibularhizoctonia sp. CBS 109695]